MHFLNILIAGIAGTFLMTGALYILSAITGKNYKVVAVLGTMISHHTTSDKGTSKDSKDIFIGLITHYAIGVLFSFEYYYLWNSNIITPSFLHATLLGLLTGAVATSWWIGFIRIHPNPPKVMPENYPLIIGLSHLFFSTGVYEIYAHF